MADARRLASSRVPRGSVARHRAAAQYCRTQPFVTRVVRTAPRCSVNQPALAGGQAVRISTGFALEFLVPRLPGNGRTGPRPASRAACRHRGAGCRMQFLPQATTASKDTTGNIQPVDSKRWSGTDGATAEIPLYYGSAPYPNRPPENAMKGPRHEFDTRRHIPALPGRARAWGWSLHARCRWS